MILERLINLSEKDKKKSREYLRSRNILNIYTTEEMNNLSNIDLYLMLDLDEYRNKEIPVKILNYVTKVKQRQYHPDVSKGAREAFLLVDKAHNILGDKRLRSIYDSSYFKVEIPEDRIYQEDEFYNVFQKIFDEYGRFSQNKEVKKLRDTPSEFYDFWSNYKSSKIYIPIDDYYKLNKEDRLNYMINNQEKINKLKNEDILKLKEILRICKKRDPRLKSITEQLAELKLEKENEWSSIEINTLKKLMSLFGKAKKNKWEIITEKLVAATKRKRSVKEVMEKANSLMKVNK